MTIIFAFVATLLEVFADRPVPLGQFSMLSMSNPPE